MKKIMFNDKCGLTQAVLEGRKTQTRRMLNPTMFFQRLVTCEGWSNEDVSAWKRSCNRRLYEAQGDTLQQMLDYALSSSRYKLGETIAIAQRYEDMAKDDDLFRLCSNILGRILFEKGCHNKMFVRADLMPHHIRITNIRVEHLQDISDEDCIAEGIYPKANGRWYCYDVVRRMGGKLRPLPGPTRSLRCPNRQNQRQGYMGEQPLGFRLRF